MIALLWCIVAVAPASAQSTLIGRTVDVGKTGPEFHRLVMTSACAKGCPYSEISEILRDAMKTVGWEIVLCRNCNWDGIRLVAKAAMPPPLKQEDLELGSDERFDAPVDFGVTVADLLTVAYNSKSPFSPDGPYKNLRLIANIEFPTYLLVAAKSSSAITDLSQILRDRKPVKILAVGGGASAVLDHYGLTAKALARFGGVILPMPLNGKTIDDFDVMVSDFGGSANNPELVQWTVASQRFDLRFINPPEEILSRLAAQGNGERVTVSAHYLRGIDRDIPTIGHSGLAIFVRSDMPDDAGYALAKAIDDHQGALKWRIGNYSYDRHEVWRNADVPLHAGAARYYREVGYLK